MSSTTKKTTKKSSKPSIIDKCQHDLDASSKLTQLWNCFEKMRRLKKWTYILLFYVQVWPCCRICRLRGLKSDTTLFHWLGNSTPTFSQYYFNYFVTKQPRIHWYLIITHFVNRHFFPVWQLNFWSSFQLVCLDIIRSNWNFCVCPLRNGFKLRASS